MEKVSLYLFYTGSLSLLFSFVLFVAHTSVLAAGQRARVAVRKPLLAGAGAGLSGAMTSTLGFGDGSGSRSRGSMDAGLLDRLRILGDGTAPGGMAQAMLWASFLLIGISMLIRGFIVGRGPWGNMFEFTVAFAFGIAMGYLFLGRRYPLRAIAFLPVGAALFLIGYAVTLPSAIEPLVPALENPPLITIHVAMAMISYGIFATSFGAGVAYLAQGKGRTERFTWLPPRRVLDEVAYRAVIIGFPIFATMLILGSWWAAIAWGRYWGWDPKETSALLTWLIYAVYLHARNQKGWAGRPAALMLVVGFGAVLFTYFGNLYFSGLHSYSGL